jgi:hypothetical protein
MEALARSDARMRVLIVLFKRFPGTLMIVSNVLLMVAHCKYLLTTAKRYTYGESRERPLSMLGLLFIE